MRRISTEPNQNEADNHPGPLPSWPDVRQRAIVGLVCALALNNLGASETALFTTAVPGARTPGAIALLAEWPSSAKWAGVSLATIGMLFAIRTLYTKQETEP